MSEFDRWQGRYAVSEYVFGEEPNAFLASKVHLLPKAGNCLVIADGEGRNGVFLAQCGLEVLALDFSPNAQEKARSLAKKRGVEIATELADVHTWPYPTEAYDVVVEIFAQFSSPAERNVKWACMANALRTGGLMLIEGYTPRQLQYGTGGPKRIENLYTRATYEEAFGHFAKVKIYEYDTHLSEGSGHSGMSAVIDLVAWK